MSPFRFRLQRLLELRQRGERERARAMGEAQRVEEERRAALEAAEARRERVERQIECDAAGTRAAGMLRALRLTITAAAEHVAEAAASHHEASNRLEEEQGRFRDARQERRVVERLRERRAAAWQTDASRQEQKDIDDVALRRRHGGETP